MSVSYTHLKFVRGIYGTEHSVNKHRCPQDFVLLNDSVVTLEYDSSYIGKTIYYKAVSFGQTIYEVEPIAYEIQGVSISPLSVADVKISNTEISWKRRDITNKAFYDYSDIPHVSNDENYIIEFTNKKDELEQVITRKERWTLTDDVKDILSIRQLRNGCLLYTSRCV